MTEKYIKFSASQSTFRYKLFQCRHPKIYAHKEGKAVSSASELKHVRMILSVCVMCMQIFNLEE